MTARDRRARVGPKVATENARTCDTSSSSCPRFLRGDGPDFRLPGGATAEALSNLASIAPGKGQHLGPVCRLSHREHARNVGPKRKPFPLSNLKAHRQLLSGRRPVCNACTTIGLIEIFDEVVDSLSHLHPDGQPGCRTAHPQPGRDQDEARACLERGLSNALQETKKKNLRSWSRGLCSQGITDGVVASNATTPCAGSLKPKSVSGRQSSKEEGTPSSYLVNVANDCDRGNLIVHARRHVQNAATP